jgi:hypothetical protein
LIFIIVCIQQIMAKYNIGDQVLYHSDMFRYQLGGTISANQFKEVTIMSIRDDSVEKAKWSKGHAVHYAVKFSDGDFEAYMSEEFLISSNELDHNRIK